MLRLRYIGGGDLVGTPPLLFAFGLKFVENDSVLTPGEKSKN